MKLFKNYISKKELRRRLDIQMENNNFFNDKLNKIAKENIDYQNEMKEIRLENAKLYVEIEDLTGFREQDQECIKALKKERKSLKTKLTKLEKQIEPQPFIMTIPQKDITGDKIMNEIAKLNKRGKKDGK